VTLWRRTLASTHAATTLLFLAALGSVSGYAQDFASIFDGSNLKGWTVEQTEADVRSGVLTVRKRGGWVRTERVLADFVVKLEVRLVGQRAKAGIFVRAWPTFDERTSAPNNGYRVIVSKSTTGNSSAVDSDVWRRLEIECVGRWRRDLLSSGTLRS